MKLVREGRKGGGYSSLIILAPLHSRIRATYYACCKWKKNLFTWNRTSFFLKKKKKRMFLVMLKYKMLKFWSWIKTFNDLSTVIFAKALFMPYSFYQSWNGKAFFFPLEWWEINHWPRACIAAGVGFFFG